MTNEELYRQYLSGDAEAFERLYLQMQGFIASVAKDAAQSFGCSDKETLDELCAEGALELCERLSTGEYDEDRGKLTTYLHPFLRGKMYRYLEANRRCSGTAQGRNAARKAGAAAAQGGEAFSG